MKQKKIILLCTVIGILLIMVSVIFSFKNQKDSQPDQAATNSVDLSEKKEEALQRMEEAFRKLSAEDQENCTEYMEQARDNVENADTGRTIQAVLTQTLEYLQGRGKEAAEKTVSKSDTVIFPSGSRFLRCCCENNHPNGIFCFRMSRWFL